MPSPFIYAGFRNGATLTLYDTRGQGLNEGQGVAIELRYGGNDDVSVGES